ncbi:MAG: DNA-3-methyladenine glycosylase I [Rhodospirillaceae bacterium]|jgi:DNA-3-methyladenine glycosylase I|nr:DNA-3-methyladenine glycosylase I [Rhodospirillaceae bacterium]MBT5564662.1 DNA-3-methyladenine glycosylase I [Rhodospirillaceae bacterium]MBT6090997.1 DNA-3-methyladenine glycosylase I [Rhodospirillaceae bacterium]MBT6960323.1 DNA-3-methyladenine glycosylase I [Rhodospirillaceae bacterium]
MSRLPDGILLGTNDKPRCFWGAGHADYAVYHDDEWGRPVDNDIRLFEKLCLEGFQAGLSWLTILRKRENFRKAFKGFDFKKVARFGEKDVERLLQDAGIVRHRGKIEATINNAQRALELIDEAGSIAAFLWRYEPDPKARPKKLTKKALMTLTKAPESTALSKDLKKRGWRFVGPTTMYALMQAMGMVNDHIEGCCVRDVVEKARKRFKRPG